MKIEPIETPAKSKQFIKGFKSAVLKTKRYGYNVYKQYLKDDEVDAFYNAVKDISTFNGIYYKIYNDDKYCIEVDTQIELYRNRKYCEIVVTYKKYFGNEKKKIIV